MVYYINESFFLLVCSKFEPKYLWSVSSLKVPHSQNSLVFGVEELKKALKVFLI
jgi:hypothetical protein